MEPMVESWVEKFSVVWKQFKEGIIQLETEMLDNNNFSLWEDLFIGKIVPHLEREGCLVIAVAGGTNTGKSTILNVLMKKELTATDPYAAATKRPVIIASSQKAKQCLNNKMFLEFDAREMKNKEEALCPSLPNNILLVKEESSVPDIYLYLDTPDIDSIAKTHWEVAEKIVSAGDIIVAVTNDSKYKDEAVIKFFRRANEEGKIVIPVMNKVEMGNPHALEIADKQLRDFMKEVGIDEEAPRFYFPRYSYDENILEKPIRSLTDEYGELRDYIHSFPVQDTKVRIMQKTIERFKSEFRKWYQDEFIKTLNSVLCRVRLCEEHLRDDIIIKEFIPFGGIQLLGDIRYELRKQIGYIKYFVLFPTSLFAGYRSKIRTLGLNTEEKILEIKQKHSEMIEKCFDEFLDWLIKLDLPSEGNMNDKFFKDRLHDLHVHKEKIIKKVIIQMERVLSEKPEWMQEEISGIVKTLLESPEAKGFYGKRIIVFLLLGTGLVSLFLGMPFIGPWMEIIAGGGLLGGSAVLDAVEYRKFQKNINFLYERWVREKQEELNRILREEILKYVLHDMYVFKELAEQFDQEVKNIFTKEFPLEEERVAHSPSLNKYHNQHSESIA